MALEIPVIPEEYVIPINVNKLRGRMLRLPTKKTKKTKKREILLIYGHHSSLERMFSVAQVLNDYGAVTMPDLPGFGGMDSFYAIGKKPSMDAMADYIASIIKLRYKNRRFTIVGLSYGFTVATKMLQRYPDLAKRVDLVVSVVGFMHKDDFSFSKMRKTMYKLGARVFSFRASSAFFRNVILHPQMIKLFYAKTHNAKHKFEGLSPKDAKTLIDFETILWRSNDVRTYMYTTLEMLALNNCHDRVNLPLWHVGVSADNYLNNALIEQHARIVFDDYHFAEAPFDKHMPNVIAGKKEVGRLIPRKIRKQLS